MVSFGSWVTDLITLVTIGSGTNTRVDDAASLQEDGITQLDAIPGFPEGPSPIQINTLQPIRYDARAHVKRSHLEDFEAVNEQSLYLGLEDDPIAEVHVRIKNETEGFVNTGFFDNLIESMSDFLIFRFRQYFRNYKGDLAVCRRDIFQRIVVLNQSHLLLLVRPWKATQSIWYHVQLSGNVVDVYIELR
ncbi:unnamed protein product [Clonostachys byssicola]|uniref:Uncharacterized protein n=1 Tax=Clonostachys byssicola TaxID=160290 RepID=A0A9N9UE24_9HYPO|nr:unnamed protein product [Clonostachys byssicola]